MARIFSSHSNALANESIAENDNGFILPVLWTFGAVATGNAVQENLGFYLPSALLWLGIGGLILLAATVVPAGYLTGRRSANILMGILAISWLWQFLILTSQPLAAFETPISNELRSVMALVLVCAGVFALVGFVPWVQRNRQLDHARFIFVLLLFFMLGVLVVEASPEIKIDVWDLQQLSCRALMQGVNPYAITIPDNYDGAVNYGPEIQKDGHILFGFCYPPLSLLLSLPGYILFGDHRYAQVAALALSGALIGFARPGRLSFAATSLFLFTPRIFYVIEQAWTEPFVILTLASAVFAANRKPKWLPVLLGLLLATKQYLLLALPLFGILRHKAEIVDENGKPLWRFYFLPLTVCILLALPFILWDVQAFYHSVFWIFTKFPPSVQSLSFLTFLSRNSLPAPESLSHAFAIIAVLWILYRIWLQKVKVSSEKWKLLAPSYFAFATSFVLYVFFVWSKRSFCNHYFFVIAALCASIALWPMESCNQSEGSAD